jgi:hypothetical protein
MVLAFLPFFRRSRRPASPEPAPSLDAAIRPPTTEAAHVDADRGLHGGEEAASLVFKAYAWDDAPALSKRPAKYATFAARRGLEAGAAAELDKNAPAALDEHRKAADIILGMPKYAAFAARFPDSLRHMSDDLAAAKRPVDADGTRPDAWPGPTKAAAAAAVDHPAIDPPQVPPPSPGVRPLSH